MKRMITILGALLIATGLKAQKTNVQKETVKPVADTLVKNSINKQVNKAAGKKDAKIAPAIKYVPAAKVTPVSTKAAKLAPVVHQ